MTSLEKEVEKLISQNMDETTIARFIKKNTQEYLKTLPETFSQTGGKAFLLKHTGRIDGIIRLAYKVNLRVMFGEYLPMKNQIPVTITALGSYGREQLCVHSDIDLMFVYEEIDGYRIKDLIEKTLYMLWDIGLKLGHRVHLVDELEAAAASDITIKSSIIESRYIEGSKLLWTKTENKITLIRKESPNKFILDKLAEQRNLHKRFPLTMEPNIKEGVGGFRDANLVFWIGKLLYNTPRIKDLPNNIVNTEDYRKYRIALEFLFRVRSALHLANGKKEDRLRMEYIPQVAAMLGYDQTPHAHMRFAKKTTESLRIIHLYSKIWLESLVSQKLPQAYDGQFLIEENNTKLHDLIRSLSRNADAEFKVHPKTLASLLHAHKPDGLSGKYYNTISDIFNQKSSYSVLYALHTAQLLKYVIPPLRKVVNLPQFDGYHKYSVDIHSLECIWHLENISDPDLEEKYNSLSKKEKHLLKVVTLLHDAGKGRKKPHANVSVSLFRIFAQKIGLKEKYIKMGTQLIQYHDVMSRTAQREDIYNEKIILRFASLFPSKNMLDMIYLLTYADMNGVGPGVYTDLSANLLKTLYSESLKVLNNHILLNNTARRLQKIESLKRNRSFHELTNKEQKKIFSIPSNDFFIHYSTREIIATSLWAAGTTEYKHRITISPMLTIEIARSKPIDLGYLLAKLSRLNIRGLDIYKLFDGIKYFRIVFGEEIDKSELPLIEQIIRESFGEHEDIDYVKPHISSDEIVIDCDYSRDYAAMKLRTKDQKGLLAFIAQLFEKIEIDIASTKIHTRKHYANDLFLIEKDGNFCHNTDRIIKELTG